MKMELDEDLSGGMLLRMLSSQDNDEELWSAGHIFQILSLKKITHPGREGQSQDRYRLIVSDGSHYTQAMLATQLNHMVDDNQLQKYDVVQVEKLTCNNVQNKRLLILLSLSVIRQSAEKIGNPQNMDVPGLAPTAEGATPASAGSTAVNTPAPQASTNSHQMASKTTSGPTVYPIEGLNPYTNKWTIKARVTQKSQIKEYSTQKGEGRLFNVTLMDESGEIRATGFNQCVDEFYDKLQEGKVYYVSKARVNLAKKKFSNVNNEYELGLEKATEITECTDRTELPQIKYSFVELANLEGVQKDATCDVIGIVKEAGECTEINTKTGRTLSKRELNLVDRSAVAIRLTLWGKQAEEYNEANQPVIAFKSVRVGDFNGRSLSMLSSSLMTVNPDIPEAHVLRGWFDATGETQNFKSFSGGSGLGGGGGGFRRNEMNTLEAVKESQIGMGDKTEFFSCRATILHVKTDNLSYPACPQEGCSKKVMETHEGWRCEKCDRSFERPQHRYIMSMSVADYTGQAWLQGFNDVGETVFGMSANQLMEHKEQDDAKFNAIVQKATCETYNFVCRAKQDTYNDQTRVRYGIQKMLALNYKDEAYALKEILNSAWAK